MDLAEAHLDALNFLFNSPPNFLTLNIGTGKGFTVLEVIKTFEKVNNVLIPYSYCSRRDGDVAKYFADNKKAFSILKWKPKYNLDDMCRDSWRWKVLNPRGYMS